MNVRSKLIGAVVVLPLVMATPAMATDASTPDPVVAETTEPPVEPTEPPVEPTEPPVDPTEPPVDPTEPPVDPTEPPVEPTEPPVEPTEPTVEPTPTATTDPASLNVPTPPAPAKRSKAVKRTSRAGVSMRTRGTRYSPTTAVFRLMQWARSGRGGYRNGCLRLVDDAYGIQHGRTSTALRQWFRARKAGYGHTNRLAPIGAQLFWRTSQPAGHVATYIGRGLVVTNVGSGRVKIMSWRAVDRWGPYLGWAEPFYR